MLKIYGFGLSQPTNAVRMVANALKIPYDYIELNAPEGEHRAPDHLQRHPAGKMPAIEDGDLTLFESTAIMKYLCKKAGSSMYPEDIIEQATVDQWCSFVSVHIYMAFSRIVFNRLLAPQLGLPVDDASAKAGVEFLDRFLPVVDRQLSQSKFIAGDRMTIADINLLATIDPVDALKIDLSMYPHLSVWREALIPQAFYQDVHAFYGQAA
ncbi:MAG: glutathione S-transferase family protein [Sneathiella sp.]|uniref:glutathione S-transferase family protein n=1 Tax=Sneathiella sp. TaxID=1964365 RepID=UPI0030037377